MKLRYTDDQINKVFKESIFTEQTKKVAGEISPEEVEKLKGGNEQTTKEVPSSTEEPVDEKPIDDVPEEPEKEEEPKGEIKNKKELKKEQEFSYYDVEEFVHTMEMFLNITLNELETNLLKKAQTLTTNFPQDKRVEIIHRLNDWMDEKIDYMKRSMMNLIEKSVKGF